MGSAAPRALLCPQSVFPSEPPPLCVCAAPSLVRGDYYLLGSDRFFLAPTWTLPFLMVRVSGPRTQPAFLLSAVSDGIRPVGLPRAGGIGTARRSVPWGGDRAWGC